MIDPYDNWWHVILGTRSSWLTGDPRGFKDHDHRIHSSGDYKNPPPPGEHEGLHQYNQTRAAAKITIPVPVRPAVLQALRDAAEHRSLLLAAASVGDVHAHVLVQIEGGYAAAKKVIGGIKTGSSYLLRRTFPGSFWAEGAAPKLIRDLAHLRNTFVYIARKQEATAAAWGVRRTTPPPASP